MRTFKTEGIVLKRRNFGEADRILTIFTLKSGKMSVLAKGVRRITSRRAGNVELLNRVSIFLHQTKGMPILTEAVSLNTHSKLKMDLTLSTVAFHILELVDKLTAENQESRSLYEHLGQVLKRLESKPRQILVRAFEVKILTLMGFANFEESLDVHLSGVSSNTRKLLGSLELMSWDEIEGIKLEEKEALELEQVLRYYLERVIESSLQSRQILKKI